MMFGVVNDNCEAIIKVAVGRIGSPKVAFDAVNVDISSYRSI